MTLADALRMTADESVALVGGGGKTTAMFRLAREVVDRGGRAITTTTTRIFGAQIALAPAHVPAADATRERVAAALAAHGHVLVIGPTEAGSGKAEGVSLDLFRRLRAWFPDACLLNEADGSRMRPFKAPADYEPVIPTDTTLVVPVVGADVFGTAPGRRSRPPSGAGRRARAARRWGRPSRPRSWPGSWPIPKEGGRACRPAPGSSS